MLSGDLDEALRHATSMWDGWERAGRPDAGWLTPAVAAPALAYGLLGDHHRYRLWHARVDVVAGGAHAGQSCLASFTAFVDARLAVHTGDLTDAPRPRRGAFAEFPRGRYEAYARAAGAELSVVAGLPGAAERLRVASCGDSALSSNDAAMCREQG